MDKELLGKRIRTARREKKITGERLSEQCNINATYLRQIESGAKTPSLPVFVSLCRELCVSPSYLLADQLPAPEFGEAEELRELWLRATPGQMKLIAAMIRSAVDTM